LDRFHVYAGQDLSLVLKELSDSQRRFLIDALLIYEAYLFGAMLSPIGMSKTCLYKKTRAFSTCPKEIERIKQK